VGVIVASNGGLDDRPDAGATSTDARPSPIVGDVYVVQPGDNLWSIAQRLAPGGDPRPVVRNLRDRVGHAELNVGDRLPVDGLGD
jgi:hypothetical protein